ncbi:MAG: penicillin-binding protein 2 [Proteobacteria bacterium]|nr:penicillin-binding protein 2 [Pseudomonadota bacterium]
MSGLRPQFSPDNTHPAFSYGLNAPQAFAAARAQAAALPVLEEARKRLLCVAMGFLACFLLISGRLFDVMIFNPDAERSSSSSTLPAHVSRADIVDRNGELLATTLQLASLAADPAYVLDEKETLTKLKTVFPDLDVAALSKDMHSGKRFVWVKHSLTPRQQEQVNRLGLPGLSFQNEERRIYPKGGLTAHIIGYNSVDQQGLAGIEHSLNKRLTESQDSLPLSVDIRLQSLMHEALLDGMHKFDAIGGAGLIMDVETGEILALVSLPDFDPNNPTQASDSARFNRATLGAYEMGSTFKIFTISQALEKGVITLADQFDCRKPLKFGRFEIHDFHPENRYLTVPEIFVYSSNIGAAQIIERVDGKDQKKYLGSLGLLDPSPIELSEVTKPLVPDVWRDINKVTIAYGHGLSVSAVQLASAAASVINGGRLVKPTLLRRDHAPTDMPVVLSSNTSAAMRGLMRAVVLDGTGKSAEVKGYLVGGKTGTADKSAGGGYNRKSRLASFIAAYPIHRPRYLVFAMIDEPKGNKGSHGYATGGWVAAPVVAKVIGESAPLLRVAPVDENDPLIMERLRLPGMIGGAKKQAAANAQ